MSSVLTRMCFFFNICDHFAAALHGVCVTRVVDLNAPNAILIFNNANSTGLGMPADAVSYLTGESVNYTCAENFHHVNGCLVRTCLGGVGVGPNVWSGEAPVCAGKSLKLLKTMQAALGYTWRRSEKFAGKLAQR